MVITRTTHIGVIRQSQFGLLGNERLAIQPLLKNRGDRAVAMRTNGQRTFAGGFHSWMPMIACQTHQPKTGAIALFRMLLLSQESLDQFGG